MNARTRNFIIANEVSPVVYGSVDGNCVTYRLENGQTFRLSANDAREASQPKWAFSILARHRQEEKQLLAKLEAEALQSDCGERR